MSITQSAFAKMCGVSRQAISQAVKRGKIPTVDVMGDKKIPRWWLITDEGKARIGRGKGIAAEKRSEAKPQVPMETLERAESVGGEGEVRTV